jgi:hypothetical protein
MLLSALGAVTHVGCEQAWMLAPNRCVFPE